jgi:hypothetical protein
LVWGVHVEAESAAGDGGVVGGDWGGIWPIDCRMRKFEGELVKEVSAVEYLLSCWRNIVSSVEVEVERGVIVAAGRSWWRGGFGSIVARGTVVRAVVNKRL